MILLDWKVAKSALSLSSDYDTEMVYESGTNVFKIHYSNQSIRVPVPAADILPAIDRLSAAGCFTIRARAFGGVRIFSITPRLMHRWAFWMDAFTKRFVFSFLSGVLTALAAEFLIRLIL